MDKLPQGYSLLKTLKVRVDEYFIQCNTNVVARSTDIWEYIKNKEPFNTALPSQIDFSQFLRYYHDRAILRQFIPNCTVDASNPRKYLYHFYPMDKPIKKISTSADQVNASSHPDTTSIFASYKQFIASNGIKVRSSQELFIINKLLAEEIFDIYYERALKVDVHAKYPDFTITNKQTKTVFHWEHFGMVNSSIYNDKMSSKIEWYRAKGYRLLNEGGRLIITYFEDEARFVAAVESIISTIKNR